jgi:hypothetical protein
MKEKRYTIEGAETQDKLCDEGAVSTRQADTIEEAIAIAKRMITPEFGEFIRCAQVLNRNGMVLRQEGE